MISQAIQQRHLVIKAIATKKKRTEIQGFRSSLSTHCTTRHPTPPNQRGSPTSAIMFPFADSDDDSDNSIFADASDDGSNSVKNIGIATLDLSVNERMALLSEILVYLDDKEAALLLDSGSTGILQHLQQMLGVPRYHAGPPNGTPPLLPAILGYLDHKDVLNSRVNAEWKEAVSRAVVPMTTESRAGETVRPTSPFVQDTAELMQHETSDSNVIDSHNFSLLWRVRSAFRQEIPTVSRANTAGRRGRASTCFRSIAHIPIHCFLRYFIAYFIVNKAYRLLERMSTILPGLQQIFLTDFHGGPSGGWAFCELGKVIQYSRV